MKTKLLGKERKKNTSSHGRSNIDAIRGRLEEAVKEKENIISQRLQEYLKSQANNLSSLVVNLLE
ncbi:hypothetical protein Va27_13950 [Helicobacter pylori]